MSFESLTRQQFRRYFQPSRIVLGIIPAPTRSGVNIITLSFNMHCSYKPPMMAVAIHKSSATYNLIPSISEFVFAVPGEKLVDVAMFCGTSSMRDNDKVEVLGLALTRQSNFIVPGIEEAIANIELRKVTNFKTGDHMLLIGEVLRFGVNEKCNQSPLLSIGPNESGFTLLRKKGIHRLGIVKQNIKNPIV